MHPSIRGPSTIASRFSQAAVTCLVTGARIVLTRCRRSSLLQLTITPQPSGYFRDYDRSSSRFLSFFGESRSCWTRGTWRLTSLPRGHAQLGVHELSIRGLIAAVVGRGIHDPAIWGREFQVPRRLRDAIAFPLPGLR